MIKNFTKILQHNNYLILNSSKQLSNYYPKNLNTPFHTSHHNTNYIYKLNTTPPNKTIYKFPLVTKQNLSFKTLHNLSNNPPNKLNKNTIKLNQHKTIQKLLKTNIQHLIQNNNNNNTLTYFKTTTNYNPFIPNTYFLINLLLQNNTHKNTINTLHKTLFLNPYH